jgi:hypothetical protein
MSTFSPPKRSAVFEHSKKAVGGFENDVGRHTLAKVGEAGEQSTIAIHIVTTDDQGGARRAGRGDADSGTCAGEPRRPGHGDDRLPSAVTRSEARHFLDVGLPAEIRSIGSQGKRIAIRTFHGSTPKTS